MNMIRNLSKIFTILKEKIHKIEDLKKLHKEIDNLERKITLFHAKVIKEINITEIYSRFSWSNYLS